MKTQDQVKLEVLKIHDSIKDSVQKAFIKKVSNIESIVNKHEATIN